MSAKLPRRWRRLGCGAALLAVVGPLAAFELDPVAPFTDPLWVKPKVLETGATLPGDSGPVPCPVRKDFAQPLELAEAVDLALCNNPQIQSAWAAIKLQAAGLGEATAAYLPTLSLTGNRMHTRTEYPGTNFPPSSSTGHTLYASLSWRLFDFGGREANRKAANSMLLAAMANHDASLQKTLVAVIQAYFDARTAKATWLAREQSETLAKGTLETAQRREGRGLAAHSDTLQATTALAKATLEKNRAVGAYQKAMAVLVYTLGVPMQTSLTLADELAEDKNTQAKSLNDWLDMAAKNHPAIMTARAQWESAQQKVTAARSEGLPTLDFFANRYHNGYPGQGLSSNQSRINNIGLSVTFPLFEGFQRTYKIRGAQAQVEQREAELKDIEHNILMEVVKAHADAGASLQNLEASEKLLTAAQDALASSKRKYEKGATDILEILNVQSALSDAQLERIRCLAEWRSARLRLLANTGVMGRSQLAQ